MFLAVIVSGCADSGSERTTSESGQAVEIKQLSVSPTQIYQDSNVRVALDIQNTGHLTANISLGERGENVMRNYCPDMFENTESGYSVTTSGRAIDTDEDSSPDRVELPPQRELKLRWTLNQEGGVPLYGLQCNLQFQVPFNFTVRSYKQVQLKRSPEVEGSPNLESESSRGPMLFAIETIGSTSDEGQSTFISGEDETMTVMFQLRNQQNQDVNKGLIDVYEESVRLAASEPLELDEGFSRQQDCYNDYFGPGYVYGCLEGGDELGWSSLSEDYSETRCDFSKDNEIQMYEGQSRIISCDVPVPDELSAPAMLSEIEGKLSYTYLKDAGSRTVEVQTRGN